MVLIDRQRDGGIYFSFFFQKKKIKNENFNFFFFPSEFVETSRPIDYVCGRDDDDAKVAAEVVVGERKEKQGERVRLQDNNVEAAVSSATSVLFSDILKRELQCHLDRCTWSWAADTWHHQRLSRRQRRQQQQQHSLRRVQISWIKQTVRDQERCASQVVRKMMRLIQR